MAESTRTGQFLHRLFSIFPDRRHFNAAFISLQFYVSCFFQRGLVATFPHAPFAFLIASVLEFLQLKYQGTEKTPFDTHPIIIRVGIASLLIYCFGYSMEQRYSLNLCYRMRARKYVLCCMALAGSVSLASTTAILFPDSIRPVLFVFFLILFAGELLHWAYCRVMQELRELAGGRRPAQEIFINMRRIAGRCFTQQGHILPV